MGKEEFSKGIKGAIKSYKLMYKTDKMSVLLHFPGALLRAVQPYLGLFVTGYILNGFVTGAGFTQLLRFALGFITVRFLLEQLEGYLDKILRVRSDNTIEKIYLEKSKKYMHVDYALLDGPAIHEINTRIQRDNNWGSGFYNMPWYLRSMLDGFFGLVAGLVMLIPFFIHSGVGGVTFLMLGLMGFGLFSSWVNLRFFLAKIQKLLSPENDKNNKFGYMWYFIQNINTVLMKTTRIYNAAPLIRRRIDEGLPEENDFCRAFTRYQSGSAFVNSLSGGVLLIGAYLFVVTRAVAGVIPIGSVVVYAGTIHQLTSRFFDMTNSFASLVDQTNKVQSMLAFMEMETKQAVGTLPVEKRRDGEYEIEFRDVAFKYPGSEFYALKNFNLKLHIGQKLAIVGMNGSGKTTMIKLLTRLYDPTEGEITLNGIDIRKYDMREYLRIFSVVFQDFKVFSFTLADNIACGDNKDTDFDETAAARALNRVGMGERLAAMPDGLLTYMYNDYDKGVEISGGEAQKIALARALYKNAPFIVLDEPTAALDPIAEAEVYKSFNEITNDSPADSDSEALKRTAIFISHRLSSCRFCDDIAVFHKGELIQRGSHDVLLQNEKGKYHELWNAQAQYYQAG